MSNKNIIRAFKAGAALSATQIVTWANGYDGLIPATTGESTIKLAGVTTDVGTDSGSTADIVISGLTEIKLGGNVNLLDPITSNASGYGICATIGTANQVEYVGIAQQSGVSGDIVTLLVNQGCINKA